MSVIMPIYTVAIIVFFIYTTMKILFKNKTEDEEEEEDISNEYYNEYTRQYNPNTTERTADLKKGLPDQYKNKISQDNNDVNNGPVKGTKTKTVSFESDKIELDGKQMDDFKGKDTKEESDENGDSQDETSTSTCEKFEETIVSKQKEQEANTQNVKEEKTAGTIKPADNRKEITDPSKSLLLLLQSNCRVCQETWRSSCCGPGWSRRRRRWRRCSPRWRG